MRHLRPASIALSVLLLAAAPGDPPRREVLMPWEIKPVLEEYRAAMEARSADRLARVVDPALVVVENAGVNAGWADYRDRRLGPELKEVRSFRYAALKIVDASVSGDTAHAVLETRVELGLEREAVVLAAVETFVLRKTGQGWRIRLIHLSSKRVQPRGADAGQPG